VHLVRVVAGRTFSPPRSFNLFVRCGGSYVALVLIEHMHIYMQVVLHYFHVIPGSITPARPCKLEFPLGGSLRGTHGPPTLTGVGHQ
jgi:hypothetical protein